MTRLFESKRVCATIFILFALAVMANSFAGGPLPSFGGDAILAPDVPNVLVADDPFFPPDPWDPAQRA
jgi:hypothetical protein